jgi:pseudouridine kinase
MADACYNNEKCCGGLIMGIVVIGAVFVDVKGYPEANFIPTGRNAGRVERVHGGVGRNVAEDIANC